MKGVRYFVEVLGQCLRPSTFDDIVHRSRTDSTKKIYTVADKQDQQLDPSVDVELNPDPSTYEKKDVVRPPAISILELRLHQFGLKPLDVVLEIVSLEQCHISYMEIQTVMALLELLG